MSCLILPRRFYSQPPGAVQLSDSARARGIKTALIPTSSGLIDQIGLLSVTGGAGTRASSTKPYGASRDYTAGADYVLDAGLHANPEYLWVYHGVITTLATWSGIIARTSDNGTAQGWAWQRLTSDDILRVYHTNGNVSNVDYVDVGDVSGIADGLIHTYCGIGRAGYVRLYRDGQLLRSGAISSGPTYVAGQGQIKIGSSRDSVGLTGSVGLVGIGDTYDAVFAQEISANPWQIFKAK